MAQDTVLQIVRDACNEIGIVAPNTAVGATDLQIIQLTALVNREGKELSSRYPWTALIRQATHTTLAAEDQGSIVDDIVGEDEGFKYIVNETIWDRTGKYALAGPTAGPRWQAEKSFSITGPYARYRIYGGNLFLLPAPEAGRTIAFEYLSENWVLDVTGTTSNDRFTLDDDYPILDSNLITLGAIWRWKKSKGLEYAEDFDSYELSVADAMARDGTKPILSLNGPAEHNFQPFVTVPLTDWNQ
jgi:hypothetical protein